MDAVLSLLIRHRFVVIFCVLLFASLGLRAAQRLPIDAVPDVTNVQVQVLTNTPSLGPVEVEQYVSIPVELAMSGLPRVEQVRSLSRFGLSVVTAVFEEGTDIYFARQLVSQRLAETRETIPEGYGSPEMGPLSSGLGEIYQFELRGEPRCPPEQPDSDECYSLMELRSLLDGFLAPQLRAIPGVVEVNPFGGELKTYQLEIDPERLHGLGLSLADVYSVLETNNANAGGGSIERAGEQRLIRGEGLLTSLEELAQVRLGTRRDGTPILVSDVGSVSFAPMLRQGAVTRDGRGEVMTASVMMLMGANPGQVAAAVRARLAELEEGLPPGVSIETYYDRSELVQRTIRTVASNLIVGGALVIVVLLLMLGNLRGGLLIAAIIPLSMAMTLLAMSELELSGNLMSLGALDFGLIIDGAIVLIENVTRRLSETRARGDAVPGVVREAAREVLRPLLFGTAIVMMVYLPILSLQGIEGKMFRPMALVLLSALAAALLLTLTLIPAAASVLFRGGVAAREAPLSRGLGRLYAPLLRWAMRARWLVVTLAGLLLLTGGLLASRMGAEFLPRLDEGAIAMQAIRPPSVSLVESVRATGRVERALLEAFPDEIETVVSRTGRAEIATDPMGVEISDVYLILRPLEEWRRANNKAELIASIERELRERVPGQNYAFSQPIELRTNELLSGVRAELALNLYGPSFEELERTGERLMGILRSIEGAADVSTEPMSGLPTLKIRVDREAAARYGVDASQVLDAVAAIGGKQLGQIFEGGLRFALQVRLNEAARSELEALRALRIVASDGTPIPLGQVAELIEEEGPLSVNRESAQRRLTIQVNVRGRDTASFVAEAQRRVRAEAHLEPGYFVSWGGNFQNLQEATERLAFAVPAALLLVFVLLYAAFSSARAALIVYSIVPAAAVGGVLALWLRELPFSISAAVGFIALSGIAVLNGVVMVSTIRDLQRRGMGLREAAEEGARLRLRAVLMTALTDALGFLPMALSTSAGAEVQRPLATVVVGGLLTATLLSLFVLPVIYAWLGPSGLVMESKPQCRPGRAD
ncbi:MAG: CusA/CzcA family heavy metal efflux RND transporter [Myxococcota bacterium]|jgi:cobalt-zinc-cadmium resistance protein CzcA|nr:CusA/CzcA family heavy metal efflux RND transporter [Myxococcota bacterium]